MQNCRMHATVPGSISERMDHALKIGNIYVIKNFQVKDYTEKDTYRPVEMDRKIVLTTETRLKDVAETEVFIQKNIFDLYEYSELKKRADQVMYLTGKKLSS